MPNTPRYEHDHLCPDVIGKNARIFAHRTAVVCGNQRLTWQELHAQTNQLANTLMALGLVKGDKVCMLMPNSIDAFIVFWGVIKAGLVIVPMNMMLDAATFARLINTSDSKVLFADPSMLNMIDGIRNQLLSIAADRYFTVNTPHPGWTDIAPQVNAASPADPVVKIVAEDSMTLIYTSGTTGTPKGIEHSHFGRLNYCYGFAAGLAINRYTVAICATPIYASGTWITMLPTMYNGGTVVLIPKFSPVAFLEAVEQEGGTHSFMVPAQYISIVDCNEHNVATSTLQVLVSAGQSISPTTRASLASKFPTAGIYEVYGMTEGFFTIAIPADYRSSREGTVGKPGFLEDIRIIDDSGHELAAGATGEIVAYGPGMMKGYYGRPDLTDATVWIGPNHRTYLRSGDLGHLDTDGFLYVSGRKKDMIKSGGINIYADDLEDVLMEHPETKEVAVIGIAHPRWSETPIAIVRMNAGASTTAEELKAWANQRLAKYQRLSTVIYCDDFPRATYGKIKKDDLRKAYSALFTQ